jgi:NAD(P)-dependent dehydrogenase (short-subunit alcohol dehydrogenase family)
MNYLIVGGSTGIGKAITKILASGGNDVYVVSRNASDRISDEPNVHPFDRDVTKEDTDWSFLPEKLDGVAYCAGSINLKPFHRLKLQDFKNDFEINLLGVVNTLQNCMPALKKSEQASVVLFSSVAAQKGLTFHTTVSAAKGGVEGLTKALSAEWAPSIRVNSIALALTDTPMAERLLNSENKREASNERHPLKRYGKPEDAAEMAAFLLSSKSSWITGQIIGVDGGMSSVQNI